MNIFHTLFAAIVIFTGINPCAHAQTNDYFPAICLSNTVQSESPAGIWILMEGDKAVICHDIAVNQGMEPSTIILGKFRKHRISAWTWVLIGNNSGKADELAATAKKSTENASKKAAGSEQ